MDAGNFSSLSAGRIGRDCNPPPQFGQRPPSVVSAQSRQKVHSKLQITPSVASGGRSLLQHSQLGRRSNTVVPRHDQRLGMPARHRRRGLDLGIVSRTLASIEHAVVADDAHDSMAEAGRGGRAESPPRAGHATTQGARAFLHCGCWQKRRTRSGPPDVDRPTSQSGSAAAVTPDSGWTSVSVTNFARPISVSSSRCSTIAAPAGVPCP